MKKILFIMMITVMVAGLLVGCGKKKESVSEESVSEVVQTNSNQEEKETIEQKDENKSIEDYAWDEFVISIDGNIIIMGEELNSLEAFGFVPGHSNYDEELNKGLGLDTYFEYSVNAEVTETLSCRACNYYEDGEPRMLKNCPLISIVVDTEFINTLDVVLPGGVLIKEDTTIEEIVSAMGPYTENVVRSYRWKDENNSYIEVHFNKDLKIANITYVYNSRNFKSGN